MNWKKKLDGSTLVENIVSLTILLIVVSLFLVFIIEYQVFNSYITFFNTTNTVVFEKYKLDPRDFELQDKHRIQSDIKKIIDSNTVEIIFPYNGIFQESVYIIKSDRLKTIDYEDAVKNQD